MDEAVDKFTGKIIAIVHRNDDVEEKWGVAPEGMTFTKLGEYKLLPFNKQELEYYYAGITTNEVLKGIGLR